MRKSQNRGSIEWTVKARRDLEEILVSMSTKIALLVDDIEWALLNLLSLQARRVGRRSRTAHAVLILFLLHYCNTTMVLVCLVFALPKATLLTPKATTVVI